MARSLRPLLLALGAFFVAAVGPVACGSGLPGNSVAKVGDQTVTKADFDHWLGVVARSLQAQSGAAGQTAAVPDPPTYAGCIAAKRRLAKQIKGQPEQSRAQLRSQCVFEYDSLRNQVMGFLVSARWLEGEASNLGIEVSDAQVTSRLDQRRKQFYPKLADFDRFLKRSGRSLADVRFETRLELLRNAIIKIITGRVKVTPADVRNYYDHHKQQFSQSARRDALVILTRTRARARAARAALRRGQRFAAVVRRYSIDQATKGTGGRILGAARGEQDQGLDRALFAAPKGKLVGPVRTQFGYYLVKVTGITPFRQLSLAQAAPGIRQQLKALKQRQALASFGAAFRKKWLGLTTCRPGFISPQFCSNAPKRQRTAPGPPGAPPGAGGPQQGPPPGGG